jgi:hypothetical protein
VELYTAGLGLQEWQTSSTDGVLAAVAGLAQIRRQLNTRAGQ